MDGFRTAPASRRRLAVLSGLMLFLPLVFMWPVEAGQSESTLTRLERRVDMLHDEVVAMEYALLGGPDGSARGAQDSVSSRGRQASSMEDRIKRLQRRVVRLDDRIGILEDAVLGGDLTTHVAGVPRAAEGTRPDTRRRLIALERSVRHLERRMQELQDALIATTSPTPSPTGDPSISPALSPTPTTPPPPATCSGVWVTPTSGLQALIDANPPRTTFCFANGLYRLTDTIWTRDKFPTFDLRAGAILDGQNGAFVGINGPDAPVGQPGTRILGGVFQHFGNEQAPTWVTSLIVRRNMVIEGTQFRENYNAGVWIQGNSARLTNVHTHHNGRYGLGAAPPCAGCAGPVGVIIEDSEIAFNNTRRLATDNDAGGTKFAGGTDGMIVRRNEIHDNWGAGLWWDGFNENAQIYDNTIYDNRNWGILWELSYGGAQIHHNVLFGNGIGDGSSNFFNNVQLLVSCSDGSVGSIEIYENTIDGTANPLGLINHSGHPIRTAQVYVHHNDMTLRASTTAVGAVAFNGLTELFGSAANNRFDHNTYRVLDLTASYWAWNGQMLTWAQWQAFGHDVNGVVEAAR